MKTTIRLVIGDMEFKSWELPEGTEPTDKISLTVAVEEIGQILLMNFDFLVDQEPEGGAKGDIEKVYALTQAFSVTDNQAASITRISVDKEKAKSG